MEHIIDCTSIPCRRLLSSRFKPAFRCSNNLYPFATFDDFLLGIDFAHQRIIRF